MSQKRASARLTANEKPVAAVVSGAAVGILGGLIGLGGAEFRLPLLIGVFRFMSLVVVASALPFRATAVPFGSIADHWTVIVNLLIGSLLSAWLGAGWATRLESQTLYRVIAVLLVMIAAVLLFGHDATVTGDPPFSGVLQVVAGACAGFVIGVIAALLGVAGGELLIPTLVLLFGADVKLAGSLSLAISLPTMITAVARYSRDQSFVALSRNRPFVLVMAAGSVVGTFTGGQLLGIVPSQVLIPLLAIILMISAVKIWRHK